jgi:type IX secretion system PorP/SprF family membrane protein
MSMHKMKNITLLLLLFVPVVSFGQQFPFMEDYFCNPFSLSPSYAGIKNEGTLFMDYRADWTGIEGGPRTYQLSYNDKLNEKVGLGGKLIYDKTDIFKQTLLLGSYTYEVRFLKEHTINFGLSVSFYRNSIDLTKYYNDPTYVQDLVLLYGRQRSKLKFATDFSALYRYKMFEAGFIFSNLMFGKVHYKDIALTYKPFRNYLVHAAYQFEFDDRWSLKPMMILRLGNNVPPQIDFSAGVGWTKRFWAAATYKSGGIYGIGIGGEVYKGIILNYSYNFSQNIPVQTFGSQQLTLGVKIFKLLSNSNVKDN